LVSSQSFPHLWKKLWKIAAFDDSSRFWADFPMFPRRRSPKTPSKYGFAVTAGVVMALNSALARAKLGRRRFFLKK
jgi:hypothetical protein